MKLSPREVFFRALLGAERALVVAAAYFIALAFSPQTLATVEAYVPISAEALAATMATLSFFSGFFKRTVIEKAADAGRDLFIMVVLMLAGGEISFSIQEVQIVVDASPMTAILIAACALSFASTVMSAIGQLAEDE